MVLLDCSDAESALSSIAHALGVSSSDLVAAANDYDEKRFEDWSEDPFHRMPQEILGRLGSGIERAQGAFAGAFYFHGTRSTNPEIFLSLGILPLTSALDAIWSTLQDLAGAEMSDSDWLSFRDALGSHSGADSGDLFRLKTADKVFWGPYAMLVREALVQPGEAGIHDFLGCPEIVEDIIQAVEIEYRIPLCSRYLAAARPCIVKFRAKSVGTKEVCSAMWYLYSQLRQQRLNNVYQGGFSGQGSAVQADQIVAVEVLPE